MGLGRKERAPGEKSRYGSGRRFLETVRMPVSDLFFEKLCRLGGRFGFDFRGSKGMGDFVGNISDVPPEERIATPMHRAFYENTGTIVHKWRGYPQHYDQHLSRYRNSPVRVLEIGVF